MGRERERKLCGTVKIFIGCKYNYRVDNFSTGEMYIQKENGKQDLREVRQLKTWCDSGWF